MATFLQIVLAVFLVIAIIVGAAWLWLKRRMNLAIGDYSVANDLIGSLQLRPARIQLYRAERYEYSRSFAALRDQLRRLGFHRMADFDNDSGAFELLLAARHRDLPVAAALVEDLADEVSFVLFTMDSDRNVVARGNGPGGSLTAAKVDWRENPELTPEAAFEEIQTYISNASLPFDLRLFSAIYEQVYAIRMDQEIVHRPKREAIERLSSELSKPASEDQIDTAYAMVIDHWKTQIEETALDRYRRSSNIDAVAWEELRDEIQVVHSRIDDDEVADRLVVDEVSEQIFDQCIAQGLIGIDLYQAVARRLPPDQQWTQVGEVDRPVRALLFAPNKEIRSDVPAARRYVYEAQDDSGKTVQGSIFAENAADAKKQIGDLGLRNAKLLIEPTVDTDDLDDLLIGDNSAAIAAKSVKEGVMRSMFRALVSNWLIWAPPAVLLTKTYIDGPPYGWGDYMIFAWTALAVLAIIFLIGPMFFYNQLSLAQLKAQPAEAKFWIGLLSFTGRFAGISRSQITTERCKALAEEGKLDEALQLRSVDRAEMTEEEYQAALVSIYSVAGEWSSMIDAQRAYLAETPAKETATVDLAMSFARYSDNIEAAEPLIQSVKSTDLPEVALIGYQYVRGLLAAHRGEHQQALRHYAQSIETARQFESLPIMLGLIAEINGYAALTFKRSGNLARAQSLWEQAWPVLKLHRSSERLIAAFQAR